MVGPFTLGTLTICEGKDEVAIVERMIAEALVPAMHVSCIGEPGAGPGIDALTSHLEGLAVVTGFVTNIKSIGIVADNDLVNPTALARIIDSVTAANANPDVGGRLSVPTSGFTRSSTGSIAVTPILSPGMNQTGCMETTLLSVLGRLYTPKMPCVDALIQCAKTSAPPTFWGGSKEEKARVRAAISILHTQNPNIPLSRLWKDNPALIPVSDSAFSYLHNALCSL